MDKQLVGTAQDFIKEHGVEALQAIVAAIRPFIPMLVTNQELIPIAIALASTLLPITITSTYLAVRTIANISLFGLHFGLNMATSTAKVSYQVAKGTVSLATDVLITKPIFLLSYPFRKHSSEKKVMEMLESCRLQQHQLETYKAACSAVQQPGTLFVIIKGKDDMKVMLGSLDSRDRVERLLPLINRQNRGVQKDSLHLFCNKTMLRLDIPLSTLPRNQFGAIEICYFIMEPFG